MCGPPQRESESCNCNTGKNYPDTLVAQSTSDVQPHPDDIFDDEAATLMKIVIGGILFALLYALLKFF